MSARVGQMLVSYELLSKMMKVDSHGYEITAVVPQTAEDLVSRTFRVIVTGAHAPLAPEGGAAPLIQWYDPYRHFEDG